MSHASRTSRWVAELVRGQLNGRNDIAVSGVASLADAEPDRVSFLGHPKYRGQVLSSRAGVVLVPPDFHEPPPAERAWIVCDDPSSAFSLVVDRFAPAPVSYPPGIHPAAVVAESATVPASVHVGACAVIEAEAAIGENTVIGSGCYIGQQARIGDDCCIYPNVAIRERCVLGNRVIIHCGTVIGSDGYGYTSGPEGHTKIPQVGIVQIDDDVEIGAQAAVDRARFGRTWIQQGSKIDNLVQVAHNVVIGKHALVVAQVGISGSSRIGNGAVLAGQVGIADHVTIGDGAIMMAQSGTGKDVPPGGVFMGSPASDRRDFARGQMNVKRLERLQKTIRDLEAQVKALRERCDRGS